MAGNITIRTLVSKLVLQGFDQAVKGLKRYRDDWSITAKVVDAAASAVERSAARASAAMASMANGAAAVRQAAGSGRGGGGGSRAPRAPRTPSEAQEVARQARERERARREQEKQAARQRREEEAQARRDARENERAQRALERQAAQRGRSGVGGGRVGVDPIDAAVRRSNVVEARRAGLAQGSERVTEATAALGRFASASDKAKAKVADLNAQVQRNRKDMADLAVQIVKTGDADGRLAAKKQGLAAETAKASAALGRARNELRALDGGLIDAVKSASTGRVTIEALGTALGNLASRAVTGSLSMLKDAIGGSAKAAMDFEKSIVDVAKVARGTDDTAEGMERIESGIKAASKELGVMPGQVAALTAAIAPVFSGKMEDGLAVDLVALTSDVTKIGVAWDVSGQEAGQFFANVSRGLGTNTKETKDLFGSINELGNQIGVKAADVAEAMQRSAGVLKGANISGQTGAALNATLIAAGASAEVAATGVRTFIARLGAGEAATDRQIHAFKTLGLSAQDVARELTSGDAARAEKQIRGVVEAISGLRDDQRLPTLIELFGSESIGSIGAAATAVETLSKSFEIASGESAKFNSVLSEYDRVSNTSAQRVEKLKANLGVLAVEMGDKLLPYIDRFVNFLTSPEGQEWGAKAVETAAQVVTTLAEGVGFLVNGFMSLAETLGGATTAFGLLSVAVGALLGPWGLLLSGAVALGSYLGGPFLQQLEDARNSEIALAKSLVDGRSAMTDLVTDLRRHDGVFAQVSDRWRELMLRIMGATSALGEFYRRQDAEEVRAGKLAEAQAKEREVGRQRMEREQRTRSAAEADASRRRQAVGGGATFDGGKVGGTGGSGGAGGALNAKGRVDLSRYDAATKERLWDSLTAKVVGKEQLKPSERKMLTALSKDLDRPIPRVPGEGHKATEMDKRLAALDPALAGVLRQGGEADAGGDLKVSNDPLSRAVYARATGTGGGGGSGGIGPGPNITNNIWNNNVTVTQNIDASSNAPAVENLRQAAYDGAQQVGNVTFTGLQRVLALKTSGGRMV